MNNKTFKRVIIIAETVGIMLILTLLFILLTHKRFENTKETAAGEAYIESENGKNAASISQNVNVGSAYDSDGNSGYEHVDQTEFVNRLLEQIGSLQIISLTESELAKYKKILSDTVVLGDSLAQAVYDYGMLDGDHVFFIRGASISELGDELVNAMNMLPKNLIFFTGLNDLDKIPDENMFKQAYIDKVNEALAIDPNVNIYICSLLPPSDALAEYRPDLARSPLYDEKIKEVCAETPANYIELNWMVRQELYLEDGIHSDYDFYTIWLQYVTLALGLI